MGALPQFARISHNTAQRHRGIPFQQRPCLDPSGLPTLPPSVCSDEDKKLPSKNFNL